MGSHPLPVPPPLHHYRILIHHLPHRGSRHHSASAPSRHRFHFRILTAPVPMTWLQESAVTVNTVDTTGRARQLADVPPHDAVKQVAFDERNHCSVKPRTPMRQHGMSSDRTGPPPHLRCGGWLPHGPCQQEHGVLQPAGHHHRQQHGC